MQKRERRFLQSDVSVQPGESPKITGYAAKFGVLSSDLGGFREKLDPTCFDKCLSGKHDVAALFNHDANVILGRSTSGTLRLNVDETGLSYEIDPPDTQAARDLMVSMKRGDISSSSFGFFCRRDSYATDKKTGDWVRTVHEAEIFDISPVVFPAYSDSTSQVRALFPDDKGEVPTEITEKIAELRAAQSAKEDRTAVRNKRSVRSVVNLMSRTAWAILPEKLEAITEFIRERSEGKVSSKEEIQAAMMGYDAEFESEPTSGVSVIPVYGTIGQKMNMMTEFSGGTSCETLTTQIQNAIADDSIKAIVLDIDSPGGTVTGVPELAAEILKAREIKPIYGVANGMAASAALWIGASCSKLFCIPSGEVGSIGVYSMHQDVSGALAKQGVKFTFIKAGKFKTEGNPYEAPSEEYLADAQAGVDAFYDMFLQGVADGRGVSVEKVEADFGQGRMLMAKDALAVGLIDGVQTLDQVVSGLLDAQVHVETPVVFEDNDSDMQASDDMCSCPCASCVAGNCAECEDPDCDWLEGDSDGCDCTMQEEQEDDEDEFEEDFDDDYDDGYDASKEVTPAMAEAERIESENLANERIAMLVKVMEMNS